MNPDQVTREVMRALEDTELDICSRCSKEIRSNMYEDEDGEYICESCYTSEMDHAYESLKDRLEDNNDGPN
jgi:formylmethanofuran dehydrogenase subunit E